MWELKIAHAPLTFRDLVDAAQTNPSVLNSRLKELRDVLLVEHIGGGYVLTEQGAELVALMLPLNVWADVWAKNLDTADSV